MRVIYCIVFICFVAVQAISDEAKEKLKRISKECREETGVSDESIRKITKGESVDDPKLKENAFCFLKKIRFINEAGKFQKTTITNELKAEIGDVKAEKVVNKCALEKNTAQESSYEFLKCVRKQKK